MMNKSVRVLFVLCIFLCGTAGSTYAIPVGLGFNGTETDVAGIWNSYYKGYYSSTEEWSGYYIGSFSGVANEIPLETNASAYLGESFDGYWAKVDATSGTSGYLTTTADSDNLSGTWSLSNSFELGFYAVKGGPEYGLYYVEPYQSSGNWSTIHLENRGGQQPTISHLGSIAGSTPVPEPPVIFISILNLLGMLVYSWMRWERTRS